MEVLAHAPHWWFLLADGDDLLLDVNCSQGAFGFSVLLVLDADERQAYAERGREALQELARAVHDSAPAARGSNSPYRARDLSRARGEETTDAVRRWRASGDPATS